MCRVALCYGALYAELVGHPWLSAYIKNYSSMSTDFKKTNIAILRSTITFHMYCIRFYFISTLKVNLKQIHTTLKLG